MISLEAEKGSLSFTKASPEPSEVSKGHQVLKITVPQTKVTKLQKVPVACLINTLLSACGKDFAGMPEPPQRLCRTAWPGLARRSGNPQIRDLGPEEGWPGP